MFSVLSAVHQHAPSIVGRSSDRCCCSLLAAPLAPRQQVARSAVVDTKTGHAKLDPIRTSYGAAIM